MNNKQTNKKTKYKTLIIIGISTFIVAIISLILSYALAKTSEVTTYVFGTIFIVATVITYITTLCLGIFAIVDYNKNTFGLVTGIFLLIPFLNFIGIILFLVFYNKEIKNSKA